MQLFIWALSDSTWLKTFRSNLSDIRAFRRRKASIVQNLTGHQKQLIKPYFVCSHLLPTHITNLSALNFMGTFMPGLLYTTCEGNGTTIELFSCAYCDTNLLKKLSKRMTQVSIQCCRKWPAPLQIHQRETLFSKPHQRTPFSIQCYISFVVFKHSYKLTMQLL